MGGADDEEWVKSAMTDDAMVVELLVRLHRAPPLPPPPPKPLEWSVRQPRSKPVTVSNNPKKRAYSHRGSPTTPLSWSGVTGTGTGTSFSGSSEESSRPVAFKLSSETRSKVGIEGEKTASKRSRKKKTLAELKDQESSLLKERRELKREMANLRMNLERQRTTNEKLKRMKIELQPSPESTPAVAADESVSGRALHESTACHPTTTTSLMPPVVVGNSVPQQSSMSNACSDKNADAASDSKFILPDLNIPFDDDVACGIS